MITLMIVPTYNEAESIEKVLRKARAQAGDIDILVVDDKSPDGTASIAERVSEELGRITVLRRQGPRGFSNSYREGFEWALSRNYEAIGQMDADLSHDPGAVPSLLEAIQYSDVVIGSRYVPGGSVVNWAWYRRVLSRVGNRYSSWMLSVPTRDITAGFRIYRAEVLKAIDFQSIAASGYGFQIELAYAAHSAGARIAEVPICFADRELGKSKMSTAIIAEALWLVTRWGTRRRITRILPSARRGHLDMPMIQTLREEPASVQVPSVDSSLDACSD